VPARNGAGAAAHQAAELIELGAGQFRLQGPLDLSTMPELARQGQRLFKRLRRDNASQPQDIQIDLGGVERSSSAAIALLLDWVAQAGHAGLGLSFAHWPDALRRIALFSNVDGLLGIETDQHG
jgi:phospholipid transport system transporter-binding protein